MAEACNHSSESCSTCGHADQNASCIAQVPIFGSLSQEEKLEIARIATTRSLKKGQMVYRAGDEGGTLFVPHIGEVKVYRINPNGKEQVLHVVGPGEFLGELSLFSSLPFADNAQALSDTVMCVLQGSKLKELMAKYPSIGFKVMDELSRRLEKAESRIERISLIPVAQRVAEALLELSEDASEIHLPMTKGDLASQLGMSQETLSRNLTDLQDEGLIELVGQRKVIVKNRTKLLALSRG